MSSYDSGIDYESLNLKLFEEYKDKNINTKNEIAKLNLELVMKIARKYENVCDIPYEDLFQEGCVALIEAIDKYDITRKIKFSSYAYKYITGKIKNYIKENRFVISISRGDIEKNELYKKLSKSGLSDEEIAKRMKITIKELNRFKKESEFIKDALSLDSKPNDCDNTLMNLCKSEENVSDILDDIFRKELLEQLKALLTEKQYEVTYLLYGFNGNEPLNGEEVARITGTTRKNVSKMNKLALKKLSMHDSIKQFYDVLV